jgi:F-type H+-transporting ATPase subunit b
MLTHRRIASLALGGAVLSPASALAAGGMPQLDFANPLTISQVVWGAIIFVVLYILLSRFALPKVGAVLAERAAHIARDLEAARASKEKADTGMADATQAIARARSEAQAAVAAALEDAKAAAAAQAETLNAQLDSRLQAAEAQIAQARTQAMGALRQVASETAGEVVSRLTGAVPDATRVAASVGAVMTARGV